MIKRNKFLLLGIFILISISSYFIALRVIKNTAEKKLSEMTLYKANIKGLSLSIIPFNLKAEELSLTEGQKKLSIAKAEIQLSLLDLLKKEVNIKTIIIDGVNSTFSQKNNFTPLGLEKIKPTPKSTENKKNQEMDWAISIKDFQFTNASLKIKLIDSKEKIMNLKEVRLKNFHIFREKIRGKLKVDLNLEDSSVVINNSFSVVKGMQDIQTNYDISKLNLSLLETIAQITKSHIPIISGLLSLKGNIHLIRKQEKLDIEGISDANLENFTILSKDRKKIDYFIKKLKLNQAKYKLIEKKLNLNTSSLEIINPIFSTTLNSFKKKKKHFSKFAQIHLKNLKLKSNLDKNNNFDFQSTYQTKGMIKISSKGKDNAKKMNIEITGFDLTPLSEALEDSLLYSITGGALNLKYTTQTDTTHIKGNALTTISQLSLSNTNERGEEIKNDSFFPLATAISLIKNDNGKIEIESAISGKKDDPSFSFYKMLRNGIGGVLIGHFSKIVAQKAAQQFFPLLLQSVPFNPASAFMLLEGGYKFIKKPRFKAVSFSIRKSQLTKKEKKHLDKVSAFLKKSKSLSLNFCPQASINERVEKSKVKTMKVEDTLELAKQRIQAVKKYVLEKNEIRAEQVIFCRPSITKDIISKPELSIYL